MPPKRAAVLMVQGTASHVGKSVLVAALCRIFAQDGWRVAPFKAQNMSLNSYVTPDGGEIGRAQAVQAEAARIAPRVEMNPILLKPEKDWRSQVIVLGKPYAVADARPYFNMRDLLWPVVTRSLDTLRDEFDIVVIEGAGSPAEINFRDREIVNMRVALYAQAPVLLVGDIDKGGVLASLVGTLALLEPDERATIKAFIINKFRGDLSLLTPALDMLLERTGVPVLGVLPYFRDIHIPEEDALTPDHNPRPFPSPAGGSSSQFLPPLSQIPKKSSESGRGKVRMGGNALSGGIPQPTEPTLLDIAIPWLPHISNADDFDPLRREPGVRVRFVGYPSELGHPDLVILPGSKTTMADLTWLRQQGLADAICALRTHGVPVIGICGGYQMLGARLLDPDGIESDQPEMPGLGLLPVDTVFQGDKSTHQVSGVVGQGRGLLSRCPDLPFTGYEIHMGRSVGGDAAPFHITRRSNAPVDVRDGAQDPDGLTLGCYIHGLFHNRALRRGILEWLAARKSVTLPPSLEVDQDGEYDRLADLVRANLDMRFVYGLIGLRR